MVSQATNTLPVFYSACGVNVQLERDCNEFDCFSVFFDNDMLRKIKIETISEMK